MFYNNLKRVLNNDDKIINKEIKKLIEDVPQIKYYCESKEYLLIDTGIIKFEPLAIVRRVKQGKDLISLIFKK